ncbi:WD repeat-containing protein, variant [Capsaspora owczarzaki ATCC 30864]|uniref:WD repeat-containing protein n=1 Tax=Capsaspora owczarzaki (strain ATCC 30864) TaxID=595528 RepID=UPI00035257B6|nr:WD repeat-containing protein [Capsaspora owczarzaki ATCC 30864]XP_011270165.1 WD repeat-containing protein, variant [Capsaspora owczarzaki ATCC 30864]|eukprot:XP_004349429.2 WD repeat-containing protein [Capsaspora owczarzaki ATCC 30864]
MPLTHLPSSNGDAPTSAAAASSSANGNIAPSSSHAVQYPVDGEMTVIDEREGFKEEYVRLIIQSLRRYGYLSSASALEKESGFSMQAPHVQQFRQGVLDGDWAVVESLVGSMGVASPSEVHTVKFLIAEQKFLELLERRELVPALQVLRNELTLHGRASPRLHKLSTFMMCSTSEELLRKAEWTGAGQASRQALLVALQDHISPSVMIPERRLETLVDQALEFQELTCAYHNFATESRKTLLHDHSCDRNLIPRKTQQVLADHLDEVWFVKFSNDGTRLASASKDCLIIIWDVSKPVIEKLVTLTGHKDAVSFVSWSPDDKTLVSCSNDYTVRMWDVKTGVCKRTLTKHTLSITCCSWAPDGSKFVTGSLDTTAIVWDVEGNQLDKFDARFTDMAFLSDGKRLLGVHCHGTVVMYHIGEQRREEVIHETGAITSICLSKDGNYLLLNFAASRESTTLARSPQDGARIHLWDIEKRVLVNKYYGHRQSSYVIRSCFGGLNESFIASGSEDSLIYIWHRHHGQLLERLAGHSNTINCVTWNSQNPFMFASASDDFTVRVWSTPAPAPTAYPHYPAHMLETDDMGVPVSEGGPGTNV